ALTTLAIRDSVPVDEQLGLLPFKVNDLAGFRVGGVVPGRAVMLSDAPADAPGPLDTRLEPHIFVAISPGAPMQTADRDAFARDVFATVPNLRDIRITTSEPLRIGGQQGHQIVAEARDPTGTNALTVVQWLRFGGGAYLQMIGIARTDGWKDAYPRFRSLRDGSEAHGPFSPQAWGRRTIYVSETPGDPAAMRPRCRWQAAPPKPSVRPWRRQRAPAARCARRSCIRAVSPAPRCPRVAMHRAARTSPDEGWDQISRPAVRTFSPRAFPAPSGVRAR